MYRKIGNREIQNGPLRLKTRSAQQRMSNKAGILAAGPLIDSKNRVGTAT